MRRKVIRKFSLLFAGLLAAAALSGSAFAAYPEKPIQFIIPFGAGGGADIEGRLLAKGMSEVLGVPVVPINKPGAGGAVTYTYVKNAKPDGYTIAWNSTSILTSTNIGNVPFSYKALDHVGRVETQPLPFAVRGDAKWSTFKEFVADCRKNPNTYKIANAGTGSSTHLGAAALMTAAGCKVIHLPVGIKRRNSSVLSGEAHAMVAPLTGAVRLAKAKKIRLLVIPAAERNFVVPDVPTAKELGFNAEIDFFRGLSVPKGTPQLVKAIIADAMMRATRSDAFTKLAKKSGFTVAPMDHTAFEIYLASQNRIVAGIMKRAGIYQSKRKKK
ncbi:MAG: tripartite tricarboxylate transporter substrate binding protein [bacterium]|nr:tripartite tricarboxylate transporter substrate binding protein [bacterium]